MKCNEIAAAIHLDMCTNDNVKMEPLQDRWGDALSPSNILIFDDKYYVYPEGYYDASSSIIKAWELALQYTDYTKSLNKATYTGNMAEIFFKSGLFDIIHPIEKAKIGDIYLNVSSNAAMAQRNNKITSFFYDDFGGSRGKLTKYFDDNWDCILRYNGLADK